MCQSKPRAGSDRPKLLTASRRYVVFALRQSWDRNYEPHSVSTITIVSGGHPCARTKPNVEEQNRGSQYSHPITSALIVSASTSLESSSTAFGHDAWLTLLGGMLRGRSSSSCSSVSSTWLLLVLLGWLLARGSRNSLGVLLVFVDRPVKDVVILEALTDKEVTEDLSEVRVVGLIVEAEGASIVEIDGELVGEAPAKHFGRSGHFLLHDSVILLLFGGSLQALPWEGASAEVQHDVAKRFHIVTTRLLDTEMRVDRGISGRASQVLVLTVRDVEMSFGVTVLLGKAEIDDINLVASLTDTHKEVVRFDITMNEGLGVDVFDTGDELIGQKEDGLEGKLSVAEVEKVFQAGTKQIEHHGVVVTFCAKPTDKRNADTTGEGLVHTGLIFELGVFSLDGFELDGNLLA